LKVRVLSGSPNRTYPEPHSVPVEQFLAMLHNSESFHGAWFERSEPAVRASMVISETKLSL
jgi:hypothetical protein